MFISFHKSGLDGFMLSTMILSSKHHLFCVQCQAGWTAHKALKFLLTFLSLGNGGVGSSTSSSSQFISLKNGWSFMLATSFLRVFGSLHRSCEGKENGETLDDRNGIKLLRGLFIKICGVHSPHITGNTPHSAGNLHPINKMLSTMWTLLCVLCIKLAKNACS